MSFFIPPFIFIVVVLGAIGFLFRTAPRERDQCRLVVIGATLVICLGSNAVTDLDVQAAKLQMLGVLCGVLITRIILMVDEFWREEPKPASLEDDLNWSKYRP